MRVLRRSRERWSRRNGGGERESAADRFVNAADALARLEDGQAIDVLVTDARPPSDIMDALTVAEVDVRIAPELPAVAR